MSSGVVPRFRVVLGDSRHARAAAVRRHVDERGWPLVEDASAPEWPFRRVVTPAQVAGDAPCVIWIRDLHLAFPAGQTTGTRLVLTQSTYQLQRWLDWLDATPQACVIADADPAVLRQASPEALAGRGPWSRIEIAEDGSAAAPRDADAAPDGGAPSGSGGRRPPLPRHVSDLHDAFTQPDAARRAEICRRATEDAPHDAALQLALASACMELQQLDAAQEALQRAASLAPDWEAVHFETGKLWLRADDPARAAAGFAEAARLMPHFAAALSNLGGVLGELGLGDEALDALQRALALDPRGHPILINIGAVHREHGRLDEAVAAFRQALALAPSFVFGHYNLGHALFLQGDFDAARTAYEEGFARDPQKNVRQGVRLAIARAAAADADGAIRLFEQLGAAIGAAGPDLVEEAESTLAALAALPGIDAAAISRVRAAVGRYSS